MPAESLAVPPAAASRTPAHPDAELASPSTDEPSGWNQLPLEVREKVVDDVVQVIEAAAPDRETKEREAVAVGFFTTESARQSHLDRVQVKKRSALERLQAVNRDFRSLSTPHLWKDIALKANMRSVRHLERLLDVLPLHASHVRSFTTGFVWREEYEEEGGPYEHALVMQALRLCKDVRRVHLGYVQFDYPDFEMPIVRYMALEGPGNLSKVLIRPTPADLTSLHLVNIEDDLVPHKDLAPVILLPSLKHLFIRTKLEDAFFIKALELSAGVGTIARLESLELDTPSTLISYGPLHGFVSKFAPTLACLRLNLPPPPYYDPWDVPPNQPFGLPKLDSLFLSTGFCRELFLQFTSPDIPLRLLHVGYSPFLYGDVDPLVTLLRTHSATLKQVHIARTPEDDEFGYFWPTEIEKEFQMSLQDYVDLTIVCRGLGVKYSIDEPEDYVADDEGIWELPSRYDEDSQDEYESDEWYEDSSE